jgi:hypothetical protein
LTGTRAQSGDWYGSGTLHYGQVLRGSLPLISSYIYIHIYTYTEFEETELDMTAPNPYLLVTLSYLIYPFIVHAFFLRNVGPVAQSV